MMFRSPRRFALRDDENAELKGVMWVGVVGWFGVKGSEPI